MTRQPHILLQALQKFILACRRPLKAILFLLGALQRAFRGGTISKSKGSGSSPGATPIRTVRFEKPAWDAASSICASTFPPPVTDLSLVPSHESRPHTPNRPISMDGSLHPHQFRSHNASRSSYELGEVSGSPVSQRNSLHPYDPYDFSVHSASRSSHDLGTVSPNSYALNNVSRTSGLVRQPNHPRSRSASPARSVRSRSRYGNIAGPSQVATNVTSSGSGSVADPCGNVAQPVTNHPALSSKDCKMIPIAPSDIKRYERDIKIAEVPSAFKVPALTATFTHGPLPDEWLALAHPEGALYFYHRSKKIFTDAHLFQPEMLQDIYAFIEKIDDMVPTTHRDIMESDDVELVLEPMLGKSPGEIVCGYYFVDHTARSLFWLEEFDASDLLREIKGATLPAHIGCELEAQYWFHWEYFPGIREVDMDIVEELKAMIVHLSVDSLTSYWSTIPYSVDDLTRMLTFVGHLTVTKGDKNGYAACVVGRLLSTFCHQKFLDFHGQHGARLCRDQSVYGHTIGNPTILIGILSPFLFYAPDVHLSTLENIFVDKMMRLNVWTHTINKFHEEWTEFTLYNTIILAANVAFLAIPSVDGTPNGLAPQRSRSAAQNASYVSMITSVGSIILALLLVRQTRTKSRVTPDEAANFLHANSHPVYGLEILAIIYSLPYALLMWGMCAFLAAFLFVCLLDTNTITRSTVGGAAFIVCVLILFTVGRTWESGTQYWKKRFRRISERWQNRPSTLRRKRNDSAAKSTPERSWSWPLIFVRRPSTDSTLTNHSVTV